MGGAGIVARMGEIRRNAYKILVGKPKGRYHLGPSRRWEHNIKTVDWIHLAEYRDQWCAIRMRQ
jgi:hypothetical protein